MRPLLLAIAQLDDPAIWAVLLYSAGLALLACAGLLAGSAWTVGALLASVHWPAWLGWVLGVAGVGLLAYWLFLPAVLLIATLFIERIAGAVDRRYYPFLPPPASAALPAQLWDGAVLALRVLALNAVGLVLALLLPGLGVALALLISGWAIGRGLFVAVAMRRMGGPDARALYRARRWSILLSGLVLALAATVPGLNLLVPLVGVAAMVHVLNRALIHRGAW